MMVMVVMSMMFRTVFAVHCNRGITSQHILWHWARIKNGKRRLMFLHTVTLGHFDDCDTLWHFEIMWHTVTLWHTTGRCHYRSAPEFTAARKGSWNMSSYKWQMTVCNWCMEYQSALHICPNLKTYLFKFQNVFVQITKCICQNCKSGRVILKADLHGSHPADCDLHFCFFIFSLPPDTQLQQSDDTSTMVAWISTFNDNLNEKLAKLSFKAKFNFSRADTDLSLVRLGNYSPQASTYLWSRKFCGFYCHHFMLYRPAEWCN